jgi:hypothetical protein
MALNDAFFWNLIVANAWILHTAFHIDAGRPGDLKFYANNVNRDANWSACDSLNLAPPYDDLATWRANTRAGLEVFAGVGRRYGRLVDDAWPHALFTRSMADVPVSTLRQIAQSLSVYETGALRELEDAFYEKLAQVHRTHWRAVRAA